MTQQEFQQRYTYNPATDKLGEGGFGSVFKAYDNFRDRWVALKISKINPEMESFRLKKEVEMVNHLPVHPNIAYYEECYTFPQMDGEYDFGILQYYEQGNFSQLLKNNTLTLEQKQSVLTQILSGLDFLHAQGIIHRDLKPQNILIVKRGNEYVPKITDFGISKKLDVNKSSVFSNSIAGAGTLAYSSPEQLGDRIIRKNTDLWSFGVIAFQAFTGKLPFNTGEHAVTGEAGRVELFRQVNSGILPNEINTLPEPWQTLVRRCLVTDPAQRIKNTTEAKDILTGKSATANAPIDEPTRVDVPKQKISSTTGINETKIEKPIVSQPQIPQQPNAVQNSVNLNDALNGFGYFKKCWKHYADFKGRARRKEFWYFTLFNYLVIFILCMIGGIIGGAIGESESYYYDTYYVSLVEEYMIFGILCAYIPYMIAILLPYLAVSVRRLHDTGKSGWWLLINLIPYLGSAVFLVFMCLDSNAKINKWGLDPKRR
jgi:serine/threonine protein kinase